MEINFVGGGYLGRSSNLNAQVCQNLYPVLDLTGGKKVSALMNTPGLTLWKNSAIASPIRGMHQMGDYLYVAIGSTIQRFATDGTQVAMTGAITAGTNPVYMEDCGTYLMIVDGDNGYYLSGTTVTAIADADFPIPSSLTYQDGYFIVSSKNTGRFYISGSYDPTTWDALDYATAESDPDNLKRVISNKNELWLIGQRSYEVWYNSGDTEFPFDRIAEAYDRIGTDSPYSVATFQGLIAWLDNNRSVRINNGYQTTIISTEQIEYQIGSYTTISDAIGFIYRQEGHTFYVLTFPTEGKTWSYDFSTLLWHTRASDTTDLRHRANCHCFFNGLNLVGDHENGKIYQYDLAKYTDDGTTLRRVRAAQTITNIRKNLFHNIFEIEFEAGIGLVTGQGSDPQAMLKWSDDGGHTWSNEHWTGIGAIGEYKWRAIWRKLGKSRERIYKVEISDPVKIVILGANLEAIPGTS